MTGTCSKMRLFQILVISGLLVIISCTSESVDSNADTRSDSEIIVDSAIAFHGGNHYLNSDIHFGFRDKHYSVSNTGSAFVYGSSHTDSLGRHERKLANIGYESFLNGARLKLSAKDSAAQAGSLNSVVYFALLPSLLKDEAVKQELDGEDSIKGKDYYRIKVTFSKDGGGLDYDDVYLYWFDQNDYSMDYLAYSFHVNDGGSRFRAAYNSRRINGIIFQDYENFKGPAPDSLKFIGDMYKAEKLPLLSRIELNRIAVMQKSVSISELK